MHDKANGLAANEFPGLVLRIGTDRELLILATLKI